MLAKADQIPEYLRGIYHESLWPYLMVGDRKAEFLALASTLTIWNVPQDVVEAICLSEGIRRKSESPSDLIESILTEYLEINDYIRQSVDDPDPSEANHVWIRVGLGVIDEDGDSETEDPNSPHPGDTLREWMQRTGLSRSGFFKMKGKALTSGKVVERDGRFFPS